MAKVIESSALAITLASGVDQGQLPRAANAAITLAFQKTLLQRDGDAFGKANTDKTRGRYGVAVMHQTHGFSGRNNLVAARTRTQMLVEIEIGMHFSPLHTGSIMR